MVINHSIHVMRQRHLQRNRYSGSPHAGNFGFRSHPRNCL